MKINVSIFGVSGYTGAQLLSILSHHSNVNIVSIFGEASVGKKINQIYPNFKNLPDLTIQKSEMFKRKSNDISFFCLPHKKSQNLIKSFDFKRVIDLAADFRINNENDYFEWYDSKHDCPEKLKNFTYGLTELNRNKIMNSNFVANPGCYPTSVLIPLIPLLKKRKISNFNSIIIDSKSGVSGAGKKLSEENIFSEINENFQAYNVSKHRHLGEIKQELKKYKNKLSVTFVPHLLPTTRGILSTIYLKSCGVDIKELRRFYNDFFCDESFISILDEGVYPNIKNVNGTNKLSFNIFTDYENDQLIIVSCIDNLIKGASGQAVQNMNLMFELKENQALDIIQTF